MEFRTLPKTGLKVSRLSFGTMTFGAQTDEATAQRMVDCCLDAGINFIDTANVYNRGAAEIDRGQDPQGPARQGYSGLQGPRQDGRRAR